MACNLDHSIEGTIPKFLCRLGCNPAPAEIKIDMPAAPAYVDPIAERQKELRAKFAEDRKAKKAKGREAFLAGKAAAGERYDRKLKIWEVWDEEKMAYVPKLKGKDNG